MGLTRDVDPALLAALAGHIHPVLLMEVELPAETIRAHSGIGTLAWGGHDWLGMDRLARFTAGLEGRGLARSAATIEIVMDLPELLASSGAGARNGEVTAWWGVTTEAGGTTLIGEPALYFAGYLDSWTRGIVRDGMSIKHGLSIGIMPGPGARDGFPVVHSPEAQEAAFAGDTGARHFVNAVKRATNPPLFPEP